MNPYQSDICVIGAGPSGTAVAKQLAEFGYRVMLLEQSHFPRTHIGLSLSAGIIPLLETLSLRQVVEDSSFLRPQTAIVYWGGELQTEKVIAQTPGFQVDRGRFDQILLQAAIDSGVQVFQPAKVKRPIQRDEKGWRIIFTQDKRVMSLHCKILIDASGRRYVSGGKRNIIGQPTLAVFAFWQSTPAQNLGLETRVEAGKNHWYWCAPIDASRYAAAVFVDPRNLSEFNADRQRLYEHLLSQSKLLNICLQGDLIGGVLSTDATARYSIPAAESDLLRVGDSAFALDPLSSQGVQAALASALQAAVVVNTLLAKSELSEYAIAFYQQRIAEKVAQHRLTTLEYYAKQAAVCPEPFWLRRAANQEQQIDKKTPEDEVKLCRYGTHLPAPNSLVGLSSQAKLTPIAAISGNLIKPVPGLTHPALNTPATFYQNYPIVPLLKLFQGHIKVRDAFQQCTKQMPAEQAMEFLSWVWIRGIIEPVGEG